MALTLQNGRPADLTGRLDKEIRVYDMLDSLHIPYGRVDHPPAETMAVCADIDKALAAVICKNLFLCNRQKTQYYLLMISGDKVFHTKELSSQIGTARLSFGTPDAMSELLDITPGSVSIMGLMNDHACRVRLLVDSDVLNGEYLGCHPCINTSSLRLRTRDVFEVFLPAVGHDYTVVHLSGSASEE